MQESVLILGTGLRDEVHLVGERQPAKEKPCREKTCTGHEDKSCSAIGPHIHKSSLGLARRQMLSPQSSKRAIAERIVLSGSFCRANKAQK